MGKQQIKPERISIYFCKLPLLPANHFADHWEPLSSNSVIHLLIINGRAACMNGYFVQEINPCSARHILFSLFDITPSSFLTHRKEDGTIPLCISKITLLNS